MTNIKIDNEIGLTTHEEECLRVTGKKNEWGDRDDWKKHQVSSTDFALANYAYQWHNDDNRTPTGKRATAVFLATALSSGSVYAVYEAGDWDHGTPDDREVAARPALSVIADRKSPLEERAELDTRGRPTGRNLTDVGEYLNTRANEEQNAQLEKMFAGGHPTDGMRATGRWITTSGVREYGQDFTPRMVSLFQVDGETWGRVIENPRESANKYADGTPMREFGNIRWFRMDAIPHVIKSKHGAKYNLETQEAILANMPFYPNTDDKGRTEFGNSTYRAWMNGIKTKGGDFTHETKTLPNGDRMRCGYGSYREDCFEPREPIQHFQIPAWQTDIADFAYQGACHLKSLTIPSSVKKVGKNAFVDTGFGFISRTKKGDTILHGAPLERADIVSTQDISKFARSFTGFDIGKILGGGNVDAFEALATKLAKSKFAIPSHFAEHLNEAGQIQNFAENSVFTFFKNETGDAMRELGGQSNEEKLDFLKFAMALGCMSPEKMKDKNGKETEALLAQKASTLLTGLMKADVLKIGRFHGIFDSLPTNTTPDQDFVKFLATQGGEGKKYMHADMLMRLEKEMPGMFIKVMTNFERASSYRTTLTDDGKPTNLSWEEALKKFYLTNKYVGVTKENSDIAEMFSGRGLSQDIFAQASKLRAQAVAKDVPSHILGTPLREETILESIERVRGDTEDALSGTKQMLDDLYSKQFTYEMLDKRHAANPIMGIFASCCGTITSGAYGKRIAQATVTADDVQNLVVRNSKGDIVAKGTLYVDKARGYAVINDFELNEKYRGHESDRGRYTVDPEHKEEQDRELIFQAFQRGVGAFVGEYDRQNSQSPMNFVNVGWGYNRLKRQTERFKQASQNLNVPAEYSFEDAGEKQFVLYNRAEALKQKEKEAGRETL